MFLNVTKEDFTNDTFKMQIDSGDFITLVCVNENCAYEEDSVLYNCALNEVLIQLQNSDTESNHTVLCSNIIGMQDTYTQITTTDSSLVGKKLTSENINKCTIIVSDTSIFEES